MSAAGVVYALAVLALLGCMFVAWRLRAQRPRPHAVRGARVVGSNPPPTFAKPPPPPSPPAPRRVDGLTPKPGGPVWPPTIHLTDPD